MSDQTPEVQLRLKALAAALTLGVPPSETVKIAAQFEDFLTGRDKRIIEEVVPTPKLDALFSKPTPLTVEPHYQFFVTTSYSQSMRNFLTSYYRWTEKTGLEAFCQRNSGTYEWHKARIGTKPSDLATAFDTAYSIRKSRLPKNAQ